MPLLGIEGQLDIKEKKIVIIGAGGLGQPVIQYLTLSGFENITIVEADVIEYSNLNRQFFFTEKSIGKKKGKTVLKQLHAINPKANITWIDQYLNSDNINFILNDKNFILETSDHPKTKFLVNEYSLKSNIPAIIGAIGNISAHIIPVIKDKPCYECIFPKVTENPSPYILPPVAGMTGSMMALFAMQYFTGDLSIFDFTYFYQYNRWIRSKKSFSQQCSIHSLKHD